jgi:Methyltransferase domain
VQTSETAEETLDADVEETGEPDRVGYSLANVRELLIGCLEVAGASSVIEIGADRGMLTAELLDWAGESRRIVAVDPEPHRELEALARSHSELRLIRDTSHSVLAEVALTDAIVLDGDHNYFTLSEELRIIGERAPGAELPLLLFHDVCWPHARRDSYYVPERIPEEHRQPLVKDASVIPGEPGVVEQGLPLDWAAAREGGSRNGVLTAIEDFVAGRDDVRLVTVPAFFGVGVVWSRGREWADRMEESLAMWDRNPVLARLEENRVEHLVERLKAWRQMVAMHEELRRNAETIARQREVLTMLLGSNSFALAERISRVRHRGQTPVSRERIREALDG